MYGFFNRILMVDLNSKTYHAESISDEVLSITLGGKGLATYLLTKLLPERVDPLSPDNVLIIATGPATGTKLPSGSRYGVFTKSPLTGTYCESYSGGQAAPVIKRTGYDAIVLKGASETPVYLHVSPDGIEFRPAGHLWGKDTYSTEDAINEEVGKKGVQSIVIGPAGEQLVRFACITNNYWRCAGRGGTGAVLGSKKVKGIAFTGDRNALIADPVGLDEYITSLIKVGKTNPGVAVYRKYGTPVMVDLLNECEAFPTQYWRKSSYAEYNNINADYMLTNFKVRSKACHRCFIGCGKRCTVLNGRHEGLTIEGPEYETIYAFGGLCCIDSLEEILYLNDLCDRLGIDTITAGNLAAFSIEAGIAGKFRDAPSYGDVDGIAELLHLVTERKGIGHILAEGIVATAAYFDMKDFAVHVKGMEPAGYDPRILKGMGLAYATSDRGACHLRSTFYKPELSGMIKPEAIDGKAKMFIDFEDRLTIFDSLIFCRFFRDLIGWEELCSIIKMLTNLNFSRQELQKIAGEITNSARAINIREGFSRNDDTLPVRLLNEPVGTRNSHRITEQELHKLIEDYYSIRSWK